MHFVCNSLDEPRKVERKNLIKFFRMCGLFIRSLMFSSSQISSTNIELEADGTNTWIKEDEKMGRWKDGNVRIFLHIFQFLSINQRHNLRRKYADIFRTLTFVLNNSTRNGSFWIHIKMLERKRRVDGKFNSSKKKSVYISLVELFIFFKSLSML